MTKLRINDKFVPVTLVKVIPQEIVRYKTQEKDGYVAAVVGVDKKKQVEFKVSPQYIEANPVGKVLDAEVCPQGSIVDVTGYAIGKGFQGMVKRCGVKGMGATHGHKFTRTWGSKGNRKPRRTMKGHPHAGHMGTQRVTLKNIKVVDIQKGEKEQLVILQWSLPGARNSLLKLSLIK